jgi:glycolate oxidase iron-sulfur subunit
MQTKLSPEFATTRDGLDAEAIVRKCVHCGFCNATCPTFQLLGDELDGPRGRIYLIKQVLEGGEVTRSTQQHLDRCLTCRNCETTCPSGVQYGQLVDIGRRIVDEKVARPAGEQAVRWLLKEGLTSPLFAPAMRVGQVVRPLLPEVLKNKVAPRARTGGKSWPARTHSRKMLMLSGCVQPAMLPNINRAAARVLDDTGIQTVLAPNAGCCGAIRRHLGDEEGSLADMRRNIDAWWPMLAAGSAEAVVITASGCSVMVKEYGRLLAGDPRYAEKAARISALARDLCEVFPDGLKAIAPHPESEAATRLAFQSPCTLQHGQPLNGRVETLLRDFGFDIRVPLTESHLCCGSAGTYSVLQPEIAYQLRDRKLASLAALEPRCIVSANVGCIRHLQSGTTLPVKHWIEMVDEALDAAT